MYIWKGKILSFCERRGKSSTRTVYKLLKLLLEMIQTSSEVFGAQHIKRVICWEEGYVQRSSFLAGGSTVAT